MCRSVKCSININMNVLGEAVDATCEVLGHGATLNRLNTNPLQDLGESADEKKRKEEKAKFRHGNASSESQISSHVKVSHLMRSLLPSSLPRCSRPLVQAKMLAMGLVLVGLP